MNQAWNQFVNQSNKVEIGNIQVLIIFYCYLSAGFYASENMRDEKNSTGIKYEDN